LTTTDVKQHQESWKYLDEALTALLVTWTVTAETQEHGPTVSMAETFSRIRARARKMLEKVFKTQSSGLLGSFVRVWARRENDITVCTQVRN
jgi:hypothetical protein